MSTLLVVGDRVLIQPRQGEQKTDSGLLLPATVSAQEEVKGGRIIKTGPGYLTPNPEYSESETWKQTERPIRYLPLQAEVGDYAFFLREKATEIRFEGTDYLIVPHAAILALVRDTPEEGRSETTVDELLDGE
ncbi:chaperonin [Longimonas halophila]|uniref:Chaperonin n=1 Tax=Longimonas halophila TaxID=1469170 RepID=A0A2H3NKJ3_9BACT|nr:co-chaperone GroES family protein [Longimonas halophila]PEN06528.1 chaperonin [Longimonas halophila]